MKQPKEKRVRCKHPDGVVIYTNNHGTIVEKCQKCDCKWLYGYGPGKPGHKTLGGS